MSTLSSTRCGVFLFLCFAGLAANKLGGTQKLKTPHIHRSTAGPARALVVKEGFTDSVNTVALSPVDKQKQQQISDSVASPDDSKTNNNTSFLGQNRQSPFLKKALLKVSPTYGWLPEYGCGQVSSTPHVPLQSANEPIYASNAEETHEKGSEPWGQGSSSLVNTPSWQALFSLPGEWTLNPRITNEDYGAPGPPTQKSKQAGAQVSGNQGGSRIDQLWEAVRSVRRIISSEMLPSRSSASSTTCILCVLLLAYLYLLFRLMTLCARLQRTKRHLLPALHRLASCSIERPPPRHGLPSCAVLIGSRSSSRSSDSVKRVMQEVSLFSKNFTTNCCDPTNSEDGIRRNSFSLVSSPQFIGCSPGASLSRWQQRAALCGLRNPEIFTQSLREGSLHDGRTESSGSPGSSKQLEGSVVQHTEWRQTQQTNSRSLQEQLEEYRPDEEGQEKIEPGARSDDDIRCISGGTTETHECSLSEQHRAYMLLCYPGLWKDAAYDPYRLESSMRCVNLFSEVKLTSCDRPRHYKTREYTACEEQQSVTHDTAALHLAATHIRQRSFAWWEAYLAMCCVCASCLLVLSISSDSVRCSSVNTSTTPVKNSLSSSHAGKHRDSQPCPRVGSNSLSSLFQAEKDNSFSSVAGTVMALLQWLGSLCLMRACLVDYTQITARRLRKRTRTKTEAATIAFSLLYIFFLFYLVPSLFTVPPPVRPKQSCSHTYDVTHMPPPTKEWHNQQTALRPVETTSTLKDKFSTSETRRDVATLQEAAGQKYVVSDAVVERGGGAVRHNGKNFASYKRHLAFSRLSDKQAILAAGQVPAAALLKIRNNTEGIDMQKMTKELSRKNQENAQQRFDKHEEPVQSRIVTHQKRRRLTDFRGKELELSLLQKQQVKEYGNKSRKSKGSGENGKDITLLITVGILLLLLSHAVPRLWAFYTVVGLVRENGVFIKWRNSSTKPSFTPLVWGVGLSLVDLLTCPFLTHFLQARCSPWEVFPVCGIDLLLFVQGLHVYLVFSYAKKEVTTTEDPALLKRTISNMQDTFQFNMFS